MDGNQILPSKEGIERKGIISDVLSSVYVKLFVYGESTVELCVCGSGENELHRNKGMSLNSSISWTQSPFCLPVAQPRSSFITKCETKNYCIKSSKAVSSDFSCSKIGIY